jgi:hypothetical protein
MIMAHTETLMADALISSKRFCWIAAIPACVLLHVSPGHSQTAQLAPGKSQSSFNQSTGSSSSVAIGITSSFGVSSSAQASPSYNAAAQASLVLNTDPQSAQSGASKLSNYNSSTQMVGSEAGNSPVNVKILSNTIKTQSTDGSREQDTINSRQLTTGDGFSDSGNTISTAEFAAQGFGGVQDLRFRGKGEGDAGTGSSFTADVTPLLNTDELGNTSAGATYGTGSANATAETRTRFQADITTSTFVNSFVSSF